MGGWVIREVIKLGQGGRESQPPAGSVEQTTGVSGLVGFPEVPETWRSRYTKDELKIT